MYQIDNEVFDIRKISIRVLQSVEAVTSFQDSTMGPFPQFGISILVIEDVDGNVGEAPVYSSYTNIMETCLLPILFASGNLPYRDMYPRMYWSIRNEGFKGAASALLGQIDMALYDLASRRRGIPLYKYIGGERQSVKMYGSGGGTNYSLQEIETEVQLFLASGVDCYKMKVGKDFGQNLSEDVDRVRFVKQLVGDKMLLAVDANQVWTCGDAFRFLEAVGEENLAWIEEPVHSASYEQIEELASQTKVPIAYGESERTSKIFPTLVNSGVSHLQPVPTQLGSLREWMEVRDLARRFDLDFSSGGYSLYSSFLMTSAGESARVEYLYSIMRGLEQYFQVCPAWQDGRFVMPEIAGLPVRINWDYCHRKVVKQMVWEKSDVRVYTPVVSM